MQPAGRHPKRNSTTNYTKLFYVAAASYASSYSTKPSVHSAVQSTVFNRVCQNSSKGESVHLQASRNIQVIDP